jgi:tetratricopeptide (TPR) repeat protein
MKTLWVASLAVAAALASAPELDQARKRYARADYEGCIRLLQPLAAKDAATLDLLGRCNFMLGEFKQASEALEKAFAADPASSEYAYWLGKAYGKRAETSSPFTAPRYASKTRQYFEKAVELDPRNVEALYDLLEYYIQAPGFLGGGLDKGEAVARKLAALNPADGHQALARIAEYRKEYSTAEEHLRRAVESTPMQIGRLVDLALFQAKQGKVQESERTFRAAEQINPNDPKALFARAESYIRSKRNLEQARELLRRYLTQPPAPGKPAHAEAEKLLKEAGG